MMKMRSIVLVSGTLAASVLLTGCYDKQRWQTEEFQPFFGDVNGPRPDWAHAEAVNAQSTQDGLKKQGVPLDEGGNYDAAGEKKDAGEGEITTQPLKPLKSEPAGK